MFNDDDSGNVMYHGQSNVHSGMTQITGTHYNDTFVVNFVILSNQIIVTIYGFCWNYSLFVVPKIQLVHNLQETLTKKCIYY